jgi:hypothetical protein
MFEEPKLPNSIQTMLEEVQAMLHTGSLVLTWMQLAEF